MIPTRAFFVSLANRGFDLPIPYRTLECFNDGGVELLTDGFVVPKEACGECIFHHSIDVLRENREEVVGEVVDFFVEYHKLYLGAGSHSKCSDLGLNELTDIRIVHALLNGLVAIGFTLALRLDGGLCFRNLLFALDFRRSVLVVKGLQAHDRTFMFARNFDALCDYENEKRKGRVMFT